MTTLRALVLAHALFYRKAYFDPQQTPDNQRDINQEFTDAQIVLRLSELIDVFQAGMSKEESQKAKFGTD